jgi:methyl-accepting chemotaxis protein
VSLDDIIQLIAEVRAVNLKIAESVEDQGQIATRINGTILNISFVADQTAFSSKNTSVEIEKVAAEALSLNALVERFTVHEVKVAEESNSQASDSDDIFF